MGTLFGTDGVRGVANIHPMTAEMAMAIGRTTAHVLKRNHTGLNRILVGKDTRLPDYVVLVSTVGGMSLIGINGFVIGPLIAALFIAAWTLFRDDRGGEAEAPNLESRPLEPDPRE